MDVLIDLEWVMLVRARCQSNPSSANFALTTSTNRKRQFVHKMFVHNFGAL